MYSICCLGKKKERTLWVSVVIYSTRSPVAKEWKHTSPGRKDGRRSCLERIELRANTLVFFSQRVDTFVATWFFRRLLLLPIAYFRERETSGQFCPLNIGNKKFLRHIKRKKKEADYQLASSCKKKSASSDF